MKKIKFAFGIHCHQPVGNFDFVFDDAYQHAYQPFLDVMEKYPQFKLNIHYTGILLDWIRNHYPAHIKQIRRMVESGQAEVMSGGFYEPILSVIPHRDGVGQIRKLSDWISQNLGFKARGMWLAERVWEPTLPTQMSDAGMEYTVIDDAHFKYSGLHSEDLLGYYITEDRGNMTRLFPISQRLRYTIPFESPEASLDHLRRWASEDGERLMVFADDGEKFGVWPGTYDHVYKNGWLEKFLGLILENQDWIEIVHFSEAMDALNPKGRIYLPTSSYAEMMHWALPSKAFQEYEDFERYLKNQQMYDKVNVFVRGGFWRNFLAKYPESNQMHKKMFYLSEKASELAQEKKDPRIDEALDHIWAGQCNCAYWHGVFGGLYLGHIRHANYQNFLQAEKLLREVNGNGGSAQIIETDYNRDGVREILLETPRLNVYLEPEKGGRITELDYLPGAFNILNTLTRREEGYHHKLVEMAERKKNSDGNSEDQAVSIHDMVSAKEEGLENYLDYDSYDRKSLIDHFPGEGTSAEDFSKGRYAELGNFINTPYRVESRQNEGQAVGLVLTRDGELRRPEGRLPLTVRKEIHVQKDSGEMDILYRLQTNHPSPVPVWFGVEFNFGLLAGYADDRYYFSREREIEPRHLASSGELQEIHHLGLADEWSNLKIELESEKPALVWRFPIETISLSEAGFERVYQNSAVFFSYRFELKGSWEVKLQKKIGDFKTE